MGAAYVFEYDGGRWTEVQKLTASDAATGTGFASAISLSRDVLVLGTPDAGRGSAYVFRHDGNQWVEEQKLTASDADSDGQFGHAVCLEGETAVVALERNVEDGPGPAVYVFRFDGDHWAEQQRLAVSPAPISLSLGNGTVMVGCPNESLPDSHTGSVTVFEPPTKDLLLYAEAGDELHLATTTPGDGPGQPGDSLDPELILCDPAGDCVARDDNGAADGRNALLTLEFDDLAEGIYRLRLHSGDGQFEGLAGHDLDGEYGLPSGDDTAGGDFVVRLDVVPPAAVQTLTLTPVEPGAGMIWRSEWVEGLIAAPGIEDAFAVDLLAGQTVSVVVETAETLQASVELLDPSGASLATAVASEPGADVLLQSVATVAPGTYTVRLGNTNGTVGNATARVIVNAAVEEEWYGGPSNNYEELAQNLDDGFISLGWASAEWAAVAGEAEDRHRDWYSFSLDDGQSATVIGMAMSEGHPRLDLYDVGGQWLAVSVPADDEAGVIPNFVDPTTDGAADLYFIKVSGWPAREYSLAVTRDADFERDPPIGPGERQDVTPALGALGHMQFMQHQKLVLETLSRDDDFGQTVAIDGDRAVVAAPGDAAVYAFDFDGTRWIEQQRLTPPEGLPVSLSGYSLSLTGDTVVVGSAADDAAGAAYVFRHDGTRWVEEQTLTASDTAESDRFGHAVSVFGDVCVVGAEEHDAGVEDAGAAYVFQYDGTEWVERQKLRGDDAADDEQFGSAVALADGVLVVGADHAEAGGAAYVFGHNGNGWTPQQKLAVSDVSESGLFGGSLAVEGDTMLVGAYADNHSAPTAAGSAYVFHFDGDRWIPRQKLIGTDRESSDLFGRSISISGNRAVVGAENNNALRDGTGAAYVYAFDGTQWTLEEKLAASDAAGGDRFGHGACLDGQTVIVGAHGDDDQGSSSGSVYFFTPGKDDYAVAVEPGDVLRIGTSTPREVRTASHETFDPVVELYDATGTLVATDDNSAADGRYALLQHAANDGGTYIVRVRSAGWANGDYALHIGGHTGTAPFAVATIDPPDGARLTAPPETLTVVFDDILPAGTLEAANLTVNGVACASVSMSTGNKATFRLPEEPLEGLNEVRIAAGAAADLQGTPIEAYTASFTVDTTPPVVIASSIALWDVIPAGDLTYTAQFSEELATEHLDAWNVILEGEFSGRHEPTLFHYDPANSTLTLEFAALPEDAYTLTLRSGGKRFRDLLGHDLDGGPGGAPGGIPSGDGVEGGDFVLRFHARDPVVGRYVFYDRSAFGDSAAPTSADAAIAVDKTPLLPEQKATFANYTSYGRGINGVMVDLVGLPDGAVPSADDFVLRVGNSGEPAGWTDAPAPASVTLRRGEGTDGSDRLTLVWPDYAIRNRWLQVTLPADRFGLPADDVFYFGNAVGDAGNSAGDAMVTATDLLLARNNPRNFLDPAGVEFPYDYNRDQRVNATDMLLVRNNQTNFLTALTLLDLSSGEAMAQTASSPTGAMAMPWLAEHEPSDASVRPCKASKAAGYAADKLLMTYRE